MIRPEPEEARKRPSEEAPKRPPPAEEPEPLARAAPRRGFPALRELVRAPATSGLALLAIVATLLSWAYPEVDVLTMQSDVLSDAPWRPFTTTLLHASVWHLFFNVYWLLAIGVHIEKDNGSLRTILGYATAALASSLAEQALFRGGIGLSGIGYGVFAYGWGRARTDPRWAEVVDARTTQTFVVWFFFCIATTVTGYLPVANLAHGVGALVGGLFAFARQTRAAALALIATVVVCFALDVGPVRDRLNLAGMPALEMEQRAIEVLNAGDAEGAVSELRRAAALSPEEPRLHYNLGVALLRAGDQAGSCDAFHRAVELDPGMENARDALRECESAF